MTSFATQPLGPPLLRAIEVLGFTAMTPVQAHALPPILAGRDVIAQARTGSGKTVAFGLGLLSRIDTAAPKVQALVLGPTRELADQVTGELRRLARFIPNLKIVPLCGGVPVRTQTPSLAKPPHIVVGTPGRILDHLRRGTLQLDAASILVLDEADRMLDMGFAESIADVVAHCPPARQTLLFSATFPDAIRALSRGQQRDPVEVTVDTTHGAEDIEETFFAVEPQRKLDAVVALLGAERPDSALIFCHTRNDVRDVTADLVERGCTALALHGELEQRERDEVLVRLAHKSCSVLVATDVAARGLDIKGLGLVITWELPLDPDVHVHRIGRIGRAGAKGRAFALCAPNERERAKAIAAQRTAALHWGEIELEAIPPRPAPAPMSTLRIEGGRQDKIRPGDLLGALTGDVGLAGDDVGKIDILPRLAYVSVRRERAARALEGLRRHGLKGRRFRVWLLS